MPLNRDWSQAPADVAVPAWRSHRTGTACPPKKAVREAASRLFHHTHASASRAALRATLDLTKRLGAQRLRAHGAGWLTSTEQHILRRHGRTWSGHPRLATHRAAKTWIPGSSPGMTARSLRAQHEKGRGARSSLSRVGEGWGEGRPVPDEAKPSVRLSAGRGASSSRAHPHLRSLSSCGEGGARHPAPDLGSASGIAPSAFHPMENHIPAHRGRYDLGIEAHSALT